MFEKLLKIRKSPDYSSVKPNSRACTGPPFADRDNEIAPLIRSNWNQPVNFQTRITQIALVGICLQ